MAASAPNNPTPQDPRPTGDLEHLFRQTFAEAEVPPRANLWEQLDLEMVSEQNDTYRRRLVVHRWVAAACLLLALGFGGWAALYQFRATQPEMAANLPLGAAGTEGAAATGLVRSSRNAPVTAATAPDAALAAAGAAGATAGQQPAAAAAHRSLTETLAAAYQSARAALGGSAPAGTLSNDTQLAYRADGRSGSQFELGVASHRTGSSLLDGYQNAAAPAFALTSTGALSGQGGAADGFSSLAALQARLRSSLGLGLPDTLKSSLLALPTPTQLAATQTAEEEQPQTSKLWRRVRLGGSYAAGTYNPNINFSQADARLKAADPVTSALRDYYQEDAETEYRRHLRAGFSQRVALTVDYALSRRFSLRSGAEVAEHRATSATSYGFIDGKQVGNDVNTTLFNSRPGLASRAPLQARATSYRYRTAGLPVEVRYAGTKPGVSIYAKVGAAVNLLLGSHSELEGSPEATRNYTLTSADSPYRQLLVTGRAGAGIRYQPAAAAWSVAVGPTADAGFNTLNARPAQSVKNQSRPYSVGVEASVEFGAARPATVLR